MIDYKNRAKETGRRIKEGRLRLGMSSDEFLSAIYLSPSSTKTLRAWENGERFPDLDSVARMADLFKCDIGYLLCDYDERTQDIADVCAFTGLSETAVLSLLSLNFSELEDDSIAIERGTLSRIGMLNLLLAVDYPHDYHGNRFELILDFLQKAMSIDSLIKQENNKFSPEEIAHAEVVAHANNRVVLEQHEAKEYYLELALHYFRSLIGDMYLPLNSPKTLSFERTDTSTNKQAALVIQFMKDCEREKQAAVVETAESITALLKPHRSKK